MTAQQGLILILSLGIVIVTGFLMWQELKIQTQKQDKRCQEIKDLVDRIHEARNNNLDLREPDKVHVLLNDILLYLEGPK